VPARTKYRQKYHAVALLPKKVSAWHRGSQVHI
jgi:hypothetical protein